MSGQIITISDAGRELVALGNPSAMLGFLEAAAAAELDTVYTSLDAAIDAVAASVSSLAGVVAGKAAASHQHAIADVAGLQGALDGKASGSPAGVGLIQQTSAALMAAYLGVPTNTALNDGLAMKANLGHSHAIADVTGLQSSLNSLSSGLSGLTDDVVAGLAVRPDFEGIEETDFAETITWTGTTAPSGTATLKYWWYRIGKIVFFQFRFEWSVGGSTLSVAQFNFPAGFPAALVMGGVTNTEIIGYGVGCNAAINAGAAIATTPIESRIQWLTGGQLQARVRTANTNVGQLHFQGWYRCQ